LVALLKIEPLPAGESLAHHCQLDNGLTVIHQQVNNAPAVAVDVWVKAGAIAEPAEWSGMAHFLEHMIFKGSDRQPPGSFDYLIENRGGMTNAATSHDYAHFFINTAIAQLPSTLPFFGDLLLHAAIPDDEFELERDVVLEEIRQSFDDPDQVGGQALMTEIYGDHPYGRPVLGEPEILKARSPEDMRRFHRAHYQPDNMTVVIVGDLSQAEAIDLVQQSFQSFPAMPDWQRSPVTARPNLSQVQRQTLNLPRLECARLMMAWHCPGTDSLWDAYRLDLLSVLLAGGRTARLVRELREEKQWVLDITSQFSLQRDTSLFSISAWLEPEYLGDVEAVIRDRLFEIATHPIHPTELARAKRLLCNDFAFSTETVNQLAGLYGYYSIISKPEVAWQYPQMIEAIAAEEVQQLAAQYVSPSQYGVMTMQ
jgi:zinc protease